MERDGAKKPRLRRRNTGADARPPPAGRGTAAGAAATGAAAAVDSPSARVPCARGRDVGAPATRAAGGAPTSGHAASSWWPGASVGSSFPDPSPSSSDWMYPPGGFMNFLQNPSPFAQPHPFVSYPNGSHPPENFHFVGAPMGHPTMSPANPCSKETPPPSGSMAAEAPVGSQEKEAIDIDDDDSNSCRSDKRLNWSMEEDIRLVSAWLHNSIDPVDGNDKKSDQYWSDVTKSYNSTTKSNRMRNRNQLKIRWERIKKPVNEFNGCYARITKVHQSGMSDDQKMDNALQLYASEHNGKPFTMVHIWKVLRHEKKWCAYEQKINKEKDKSATKPSLVVNVDDTPKERPVGHKKAKDERNGKRKAAGTISVVDEKLDKFIEASTKAREDREKMAEVQQSLANKKLEVAKLNHKAAQEQTKCKMLDIYKDLMFAPTSDLSEEALAERTKAMECMRLAMFAKDD